MDRKGSFQLENLFSGSNLELEKVSEYEIQIDEDRLISKNSRPNDATPRQNTKNIFQSR